MNETALRNAWARARARYPADAHLPVPLWMSRGLTDGPSPTWTALERSLAEGATGDVSAISVYVHIPFCATRCPFCDCHAAVLPRDGGETVERYLRVLLGELARWASLPGLAGRAVTTVHFGGGTPLAIGEDALGRVTTALRDALATDAATEWAIETTARSLTPAGREALGRLGFTRVHVGVQSLQPGMRRLLGRRGGPAEVLEGIAACVDVGCIVSADLLYGLPGQTAEGLCADIGQLASAGAEGVSLYHLNHGSRNQAFMARHGLASRDEGRLFADFTLLAHASEHLETLGYARNHVTHFARGRDGNLYSRHAVRGEDLLALGSSADGVFGARFYRHDELERYLEASPGEVPVDSGTYNAAEQRARPLVAALMGARVEEETFDAPTLALVEGLERDGLLASEGGGGEGRRWRLTATGSWFSGAITAEAWELHEEDSQTGG